MKWPILLDASQLGIALNRTKTYSHYTVGLNRLYVARLIANVAPSDKLNKPF
jgi:hypothetical protein